MEECKKAYMESVHEGQRCASSWMLWQLAWFAAIRYTEIPKPPLPSIVQADLY